MLKLKTRIVTPAIAGITELIGLIFFIGVVMISPAHGRMMVSLVGMFFGRIALFNQPVIGADWLDRIGGRPTDQVRYLRRCSPPVDVSCDRWGSTVEKVARGWPVM
ncbi:MAG: hypothetical protein LKH74_11370 [Levilactobacillus sp.]|jgi:hypothetical protein|uniref:hypothetical protein n=1 Tax=Levilactobacillus sp. TaxID=2767919 RepID=UPI002586E398|nr:hypothetical protein [Levilactobacillus sp.]MCH4124205.1 hypothetical protein [Levilactobacillus sp.]MCI1554510.1 hypothetical protein [Levilactobacillus sp.]MCI1598351.1 hypothetical protein [Levilactobacillus sp.]MCI1605865.1 hypothetical protein [Levilactobacillus sp.]